MDMRKHIALGILCLGLTYGSARLYRDYSQPSELPRVRSPAGMYAKPFEPMASERAYWFQEILPELASKLGGA